MVTEKASERRASARRPIKLAARLEIGITGRWPCQITDFCAEGLFLRYSDDASRQIAPYFTAVPPPIRVVFREPGGGPSHRLHAQPVRRIDGAMGVEFTQSNPTAITTLLHLCGEDRYDIAPGPGQGGDRAAFILRQCTRETARFVEPLMTVWFKAIGDQLNHAARHATSDRQAREFLDAAVKLRARQRPFWHMMSQVMESPVRQPDEEASGGKFQLNLVEKGEFEDWLLLRVMVTKAETQFRGALLQLKMRLDKAGIVLQTGHQNPLGPILVCDAFRQALEHLDCSRAADKVAFRVFEQEVVRHLEPLYNTLNQILIRQGILPDLDLSRYLTERNPVAERAAQRAAEKPVLKGEAPPSTPAERPRKEPWAPRKNAGQTAPGASATLQRGLDHTQSVFAMVEHLLAMLRQSRTASGKAGAPVFDPDASPLSLPELQRELAALAGNGEKAALASLRQRVIGRVSALKARRLDPAQEAVVDVVDRFFASLGQSARLSAGPRAQLQRLDVLVLRAVLEERRFFEDADSPVRGVLNRIAQLGTRGSRAIPVAQRKIDSLVEQINRDFGKETQVFRAALAELDELIAQQDLAYRSNVERVTAAAEGAQKVDDARKAVALELERRLAGRQVPRALVSLLNGGWRDLLALTFVRRGPDSSLWHDYLAVVDSLLTFSRDPETAVNLPELLQVIQEGLATISSSQRPAGQVRDELRRFLTGQGADAAALIEMPPGPEENPGDSSVSGGLSRQQARQQELSRWISRAQGLQLGDWMRLQEDPQNPIYVRLVWIGRKYSRFVFVNHQGMKEVEMDLPQLAGHLQRGTVIADPGYERPIVDESIDRMVRQVYEQASRASTHDEVTGLPTRREFERRLGQWLAANAVRDTALPVEQKVLVALELQQFRELGDTAGFSASDEALRQAAGLLRILAGEEACLARLGGSRFALLLDAATAEVQLGLMIERIQALSLNFHRRAYRLSVNAGLVIDQPGLATPEQWLGAAEEALVRCRRQGQDGLAWYAPEPGRASEQARIGAKIAAIADLDRERVLLRRQKILPLHGEAALGVQHQVLFSLYDDYGQLIHGPGFVRMAEHHNRMRAVDRWLVGYLLDWLARSPKAVEKLGGVGIGLSGRSLSDASLLEFIFDRMSQQDAPIEHLWFEIAEAAAAGNLDYAAGFMAEMRELGCRFCLGSFSGRDESYETLRRLPVDRIKLDETFVMDLLRSEADQVMVRVMVERAHYLGREVIACPVDERSTLDLLCELGVDYAQGHAIEKPRALGD